MPLTNEHGTELIIRIFMSDTVSAKCCHKQVCSPSSSKLGHPAYEKHAHAISLSSVTGVSSFSTEELIEMNQNCFFSQFERKHLPGTKSKLSITGYRRRVFLINKKTKSGEQFVKHKGFQRHSSSFGRLPALLKRVFFKDNTDDDISFIPLSIRIH